jgi:hypothetical protein
MHRSGASALAGALSFCGYALPGDLMRPQGDNPKGFWEPKSVVYLNNEILSALGTTWERPGPFLLEHCGLEDSHKKIADAVEKRWLEKAVEALKTSYGDAPQIVLKDPRLCLFLPLWRRACEVRGYSPQFILIHRNPLEVAFSLRARNNTALRPALLLWEYYVLNCLDQITPDAAIAYDALLAAPDVTLKRLFDRLQIHAENLSEERAAELREFVSAEDRHQTFPADAISRTPRVAELVKETWALLRNWDETVPNSRAHTINHIKRSFGDAIMLAGAPVSVSEDKMKAIETGDASVPPAAPPPRLPEKPRVRKSSISPPEKAYTRTLVFHYHLFKNAGTSVDEILRQNFAGFWAEQEFHAGGWRANLEEVAAYLRARPELKAFSSHTALLPVPKIDGVRVFPIFFVRHPIDRLQSAYAFERKQKAETHGARLAKEHDFAGYVRELLKHPRGQARNFQTTRLSFNEPARAGSERERAMRTLQALPFVGLVDAYDRSVERLETLLKPHFPDFRGAKVHKNVTRSKGSELEERLASIEKEVGSEFYAEICAANSDDMEIYSIVKNSYADS